MSTYLCYIHVAGRLTPELRTFDADAPADLPDMILAELRGVGPQERIDRIEVCDAANELIATIDGEAGSSRNH